MCVCVCVCALASFFPGRSSQTALQRRGESRQPHCSATDTAVGLHNLYYALASVSPCRGFQLLFKGGKEGCRKAALGGNLCKLLSACLCPSVSLSVSFCLHLSVSLSLYLSALSLSISLPLCLLCSVCQPLSLSVSLCRSPSVCVSVSLPLSVSSLSLSVCLPPPLPPASHMLCQGSRSTFPFSKYLLSPIL